MARRKKMSPYMKAITTREKITYGKPFRKKTNLGKFKKGTWIKYKYVNGRRVGSVKSRK